MSFRKTLSGPKWEVETKNEPAPSGFSHHYIFTEHLKTTQFKRQRNLPSNAMATDAIDTRNRGVEMKPLHRENQTMSQPTSGAEAPSGFILKLYQMVNGAPDEVIAVSWSPVVFDVE